MVKNLNKIKKAVLKSALEGIPTATLWILSFLLEMTGVTISTFLSPSIYADFPNYHNAFDFPVPDKKKNKFKENTIRQSIRRLKRYGFVKSDNGKYFLSKKGREFLNYILNRKKILEKKWDGKYRVVIFDIPEEKRKTRDWLRQELYLVKYNLLQESVFIGKCPLPQDLIKEIKKKKIGNYVNYLLVDKVYQNIKKEN